MDEMDITQKIWIAGKDTKVITISKPVIDILELEVGDVLNLHIKVAKRVNKPNLSETQTYIKELKDEKL